MSCRYKIVFFQRKPKPFHKSIEWIFEDVRSRLPADVKAEPYIFSRYSSGLINRIRIMLEAYRRQGDVNHITGDVHFAVLLLKARNTILTIHDCGVLYYTSGLKRAIIRYFWFTLPLRKVRFVSVVSEATKKELLKHVKIDKNRIKIIPVAISTAFKADPKAFNSTNPLILHIGTAANKNIENLIEALRGVSCRLEIVGVLSDDIRRRLQENKISWTNVHDISNETLVQKYRDCDIVAFVSAHEGFGMPILEAQATGRPVITSNISSMPEVAGDGAYFADPFDPQSIRQGILTLINNEQVRTDCIRKGFENISRFHPDQIARQYLSLYNLIIEEKNDFRTFP